jgi:hypothetical protein
VEDVDNLVLTAVKDSDKVAMYSSLIVLTLSEISWDDGKREGTRAQEEHLALPVDA